MPLAPWRSSLSRAIHHNRSQIHSRYFQLATVKENGLPANRTVVFRGFLNDTNQIKIITDFRSNKISELENKPWGEICWYFTKTREQFRITGIINIIKAEEENEKLLKARQETWQNLSDSARIQFAWPNPGKKRITDKNLFSLNSPDCYSPLDNFCLLLFNPQKVDHLQLKGDPQNRYLYTLNDEENWLTEEVNP